MTGAEAADVESTANGGLADWSARATFEVNNPNAAIAVIQTTKKTVSVFMFLTSLIFSPLTSSQVIDSKQCSFCLRVRTPQGSVKVYRLQKALKGSSRK